MKNLTRSVMLALTLVLLLGLYGTSYAQDNFCFGLSDEDCELYYSLSENSEFPTSSAFELNVDMDMTGEFDGETEEEIAMAFFLSGAYVVDEAAMEAATTEFNETPILDVSAGTFLDLARGVVGGFDAELQLDYEFPPEMGVPPMGPFNVWLVDGVGYFDFTPLSAFDPTLTGVYGVNLFDLIEVPLQNVHIGDLFEGLGDMSGMGDDPFGMGSNPMMGEDSTNPFENFGLAADLSEEDIASFYSVERADDESVDGVDVVVFVSTIDIEAAMQVDAIVATAYQSAVQSGLPEDISEEDFGAAMAEALAGSTVTATEKIDAETGIAMQVTSEVNLTLDAAPIAALSGDQEEGTFTINATFDFIRSNVNAVDAIELPEGAQEIPAETLLGSF